MKFETDFASSPLAKEYSNLFVEITQINNPSEEKKENYVMDELKDDIKHNVRRQARQEAYDKVRDIPGVGDALTVKQHFDFFSRFKKNKDK